MKEFCSKSNTPHSNGSAGGSLPDLIELSSSVGTIELLGPVPLPISSQDMTPRWYVARVQSDTAKQEVELSLLVFGNPEKSEHAPLVRIHSTCFTGDVLGSLRCDCGPQLDATIDKMSVEPSGGILLYMAQHEGRGIGLWAKAQAYALQDQGLDTYEANRSLGFQDDHRDYQTAVTVLKAFLGDRPFRLLTNNPDKVVSLSGGNLGTCIREELVAGWGKRNQRYLDAKRRHGHMIGE